MTASMGAHGRLLGTPRFSFDGAVYEPPPTKATALLCYLAIKEDWCSRDELAYVFYADSTDDAARTNLRQVLSTLRRQPYSSGLVTEARRVRWPIQTDVQMLRRAILTEDVASAGAAYGGALLEGLTLVDATEFAAWLDLQRDELHAQWRDLLLRHVDQMEPAMAGERLRTVLRHDSLDEEVLQAYLKVAVAGGQPTAALRAFRAFRHNLNDELGVEPTVATLALAETLEQMRASDTHDVTRANAGTPKRRTSTSVGLGGPATATSFVGRAAESSAAAELLRQRDCRLLSIVGAGGSGKSRLALQVASLLDAEYPDGRTFVALDSLTVADAIPATIAAALGLAAEGRSDPLGLVIDAIGEGAVLLVLDNFEHVLDGAAVCSRLLGSCPNLDLIVTSRERLNLVEEWVLSLQGMDVPTANSSTEEMRAADSVTLFIARARQVRHDFAVGADDVAAIAEICRLVEGYPLAIEIASTWVRTMSPADIAASLLQSDDVLERPTRNVPARHRSMHATFEYSWALLPPAEQVALRDLSVFIGGFLPEAAAAVTGVSVMQLTSLVDKSLLRVSADGRYDRHPLLHQFTAEKLADVPAIGADLGERHGRYFLRLLRERSGDLYTRRRPEAVTLFEAEHPNLVAAWRWAVATVQVQELAATTVVFHAAFSRHLVEGRALLAEAIACLDASDAEHQSALSYLLVAQAHFIFMQHGVTAEHDASIEYATELATLRDDPVAKMYCLIGRGVSWSVKGDVERASAANREGLELARVHGGPGVVGIFLANQLALEWHHSEESAFVAQARAAAAETEALGDAVTSAHFVMWQGIYLLEHGDEQGEALVQVGLQQLRSIGDRWLEPFGLLASRAAQRGEHAEAEALAQEGFVRARKSGAGQSIANMLLVLGEVASARGEHVVAAVRYSQGFQAALLVNNSELICSALIGFVGEQARLGRLDVAATLLAYVKQLPEANRAMEEITRLDGDLSTRLPEREFVAAVERGSALDLQHVTAELSAFESVSEADRT